jgi:hypothetical protein
MASSKLRGLRHYHKKCQKSLFKGCSTAEKRISEKPENAVPLPTAEEHIYEERENAAPLPAAEKWISEEPDNAAPPPTAEKRISEEPENAALLQEKIAM